VNLNLHDVVHNVQRRRLNNERPIALSFIPPNSRTRKESERKATSEREIHLRWSGMVSTHLFKAESNSEITSCSHLSPDSPICILDFVVEYNARNATDKMSCNLPMHVAYSILEGLSIGCMKKTELSAFWAIHSSSHSAGRSASKLCNGYQWPIELGFRQTYSSSRYPEGRPTNDDMNRSTPTKCLEESQNRWQNGIAGLLPEHSFPFFLLYSYWISRRAFSMYS